MRGVLAVLLILAVVTGCSDGLTVAGAPASSTPRVTATAAPVTPTGADEPNSALYLASTRGVMDHPDRWSDTELLALAKGVCEDFDNGSDFAGVVQDGIGAGLDAHDAGVIIGGAVAVFCPEYKSEVPGGS